MPNNNLMPEYKNTCWRVTEPFDVYVRRGVVPSNTYFGSSMAYGNVWEQVTLAEGTVISALQGGVFVALDDARYPAEFELSDKHPFEKVYFQPVKTWPLDKLTQIDQPNDLPPITREDGRFTHEELIAVGGQIHGRGIDWIYES